MGCMEKLLTLSVSLIYNICVLSHYQLSVLEKNLTEGVL